MAHHYAVNGNMLLRRQGPQGREAPQQTTVYTITVRLPIEADGRQRYQIRRPGPGGDPGGVAQCKRCVSGRLGGLDS